jgi:hypothetical protein
VIDKNHIFAKYFSIQLDSYGVAYMCKELKIVTFFFSCNFFISTPTYLFFRYVLASKPSLRMGKN